MKVNNGLITGGKGEGGNDSLIIGGKVRLNDNIITGEKGEGKQRSYCRWGLGGGNQPLTCHVQMLEFRVTMTIFFW